MANDSTYRVAGTNVPGCKLLYAQVLPNGASTPTIGENSGKVISSVGWTSTGLLTVTLNDTYLYADCFLSLRLATAADTQVQLKSFTASTTKIISIDILTAGSLADIAADAGNIIGLLIVARDSSAQ
jgi:hypothetical protein